MRPLTASSVFALAAGAAAALMAAVAPPARAADTDAWVTYAGGDGPGKGKRVVLVSGDEEYRSEEALPQLGRILADRHGFACTVVFAVDEKGEVNPKFTTNLPGLQALDGADLLVVLARFRAPPPEQMAHVDAYLKAGKPVIGLRTATHAFSGLKGQYEPYNYNYKGPEMGWAQGFGKVVLGETWVAHHGAHKVESTRGLFAPGAAGNPLLSGIADGAVWGATDVYTVHLPADAKPLLLGQVLKRVGPDDKKDKNYGMRPTDVPLAGADDPKKKNDPMMPVAWTRPYELPGGKPGKAFATTMGSATDLENEPFRRLLVNAAYDLTGLPVPAKAEVGLVGEYKPSQFGFDGHVKGTKPADRAAK